MSQNTSSTTQQDTTKVPAIIIYTAKLLQLVSKSLVTKFAVRLFISPFKHKIPKREFDMDEHTIQTKIIVPEINKEVVVYEYGKAEKTILLAHGWSGRGTQLVKIADYFKAKGYKVVSFDAPSHGKSSGSTTSMPEFIATILFLEKKYGPFEFAIGHSLGGMSLLNAVKNGLHIKKLVTIGAADIISDILLNFTRALQLKDNIATSMKVLLDEKFHEDINNISAHIAAKDVKIPTLIVHDEHDMDVPVACAHNIHKELSNGSILVTKHLGHRKILGKENVIEKIGSFLLS